MVPTDLQAATLVLEQKTGCTSKSIDQRLPLEPGDRTESCLSFFLSVSAGVALVAFWITTVTKLGRYVFSLLERQRKKKKRGLPPNFAWNKSKQKMLLSHPVLSYVCQDC
jgi:hypothetical protein